MEGDILRWIQEWLHGCSQRVVLNGQKSRVVSVSSGVPQGSVLGPVLFSVFINDIDEGLSSRILKFADDTKIYLDMKDENSHRTLQEDLNTLCQWSQTWQMLFNPNKCTVLHFGYNNLNYDYQMDGVNIKEVEEQKDLGIILHKSLKPSQQCIAAAKKGNKILGMIKRNIHNKSLKILKALYRQLVRPHLEYAIQAWRPWMKKDISLLEKVQRRATKMVRGFEGLTYEQRLRRWHLLPLERRQERGDVIQSFRMIKEIDKVQHPFQMLEQRHGTRGHSLKLQQQFSQLDIRKLFFLKEQISHSMLPRGEAA